MKTFARNTKVCWGRAERRRRRRRTVKMEARSELPVGLNSLL